MVTTAPAARPATSLQDDVRRRNLGGVLSLLHGRGTCSRADLTAATGLNRSTIKALIRELAEAGLVAESPAVGRGGSGRPSILVAPATDTVHVVSVDVGPERLTVVRMGLGGRVLDRRDLPQSPEDLSAGRTVARLCVGVRAVLDSGPGDGSCLGVGVGVGGLVDADAGVVRRAPDLGWVDVPLRHLLGDALGGSLPVHVGNAGDLGALAEHSRGAGRGTSDLVFVSGDASVDGGVIIDGRPLRGAAGYAGELGHMTVDTRGAVCHCGRRGCWGTQIGTSALMDATRAPAGTSLEEVLSAYGRGERWASPGVRRVGRALGAGLASLVNIFNPQVVVVGGSLRHVLAATEPLVREALSSALPASSEHVRLTAAELGDDAVVVGAAELAFVPLLQDPLTHRPTVAPT